jgi:hypothetical protein
VLALTDHDTTDGLAQAQAAAEEYTIELVRGVEISVSWGATTLHVVGLGVDPGCAMLSGGLEKIRRFRYGRAQAMSERLARLGVHGTLEGALRLAGTPQTISRTHFARFLVACGAAKSMKVAFQRYLGDGKPAYVCQKWAELGEAIAWIKAAGGLAVLAHPGRYALRPARFGTLLGEFREAGGDGLEVLAASHTPQDAECFARHATERGLCVSLGSDFHGPEESWLDLGELPALPAQCEPIWQRWPSSVTRRLQ